MNWPTRPANAAWSRGFPRATWGGFSHHVDRTPHRRHYWLTSQPDEAAAANMAEVTALSLQAQALRDAGERVMSTAEMTGIQALERQHPPIPRGPGRVERRELEAIRRGTVTWIANVDGAPGTVVAPSVGPTRTAEDCVAPMTRTVAADPQATRWHVTDNLHMHQSESLVRLVAAYDGRADDLGHKATRGMLQSLATRAAF